MPQTQFDPDRGPAFKGEFIKFEVNDPVVAPHVANHVLNPDAPFNIHLEWRLTGADVPLYIAALGGDWSVEVFAEVIGPGTDLRIANGSLAAGAPALLKDYSIDLTVAAGTLQEGGIVPPTGDPANSGVYKLIACVFLNSDIGPGGFDITGFAEGPMIRVENPE